MSHSSCMKRGSIDRLNFDHWLLALLFALALGEDLLFRSASVDVSVMLGISIHIKVLFSSQQTVSLTTLCSLLNTRLGGGEAAVTVGAPMYLCSTKHRQR